MHKVGDKIVIDGKEVTVFHAAKAIDENCKHEWHYPDVEHANPTHCLKCGISFTRYIHCL